jgi:hypothetical protein
MAASASYRSQDTLLKHCWLLQAAGRRCLELFCALSVHAKMDMFSRSSISANYGVRTSNPQVGTGVLDVRTDHRLLIFCYAFGTARVSHGALINGLRFAGSTAAENSS